ncbi:MAG TPA: hypothetical protein VHQ47_19440 [Phycisphaerae bacterium]|jgi:hypothetical protein|nr:hypothetical protein [Phycisphaerae bacterium]
MFGQYLTTAQKIQVGVIIGVLSLSAYELYTGTRPQPDRNIASWVEPRRVGIDPSKPISANNPLDPTKSGVATLFNCYDGRLEIIEYPPDSGLGMQLRFEPDKRRKTFQLYKDPTAWISSIKDSYHRALTMAAYSAAARRPLGVLNSASLTKAQLAQEKKARESMLGEIARFDEEAQAGVIEKPLYAALVSALTDFRKLPGDTLKSAPKAAAARKVVAAALAYMDAVEKRRLSAVNTYVAAVDKLLQDAQKPKVATAGQALQNRWKNGPMTAPVMAAALARS